jgi:hypothetical protein
MLKQSALVSMHSDSHVLIKTEYTLFSFQFIHLFIYSVSQSVSQSVNISDSCGLAVPYNSQHETATRSWNYKLRLSYFYRGVSIYYSLFYIHGEFYCFRLTCCFRETRAQLTLVLSIFPFQSLSSLL